MMRYVRGGLKPPPLKVCRAGDARSEILSLTVAVRPLSRVAQLAHNSTLQTIDLSGNEIGSAAAIELCTRLLGRTNSIRRLCLSGNGIDAAAAASQLKHKLGLTGLILEL